MGYVGTITPPVIARNVLENPAWYTAYTPYQPEISQGRLEAILNFQTLVTELTGLDVANASLLDEATAAAEAMTMARRLSKSSSDRFFVHADTHPQTLTVMHTRAEPIGIELVIGGVELLDGDDGGHQGGAAGYFGALFSLPTSTGAVIDWTAAIARVHELGGIAVVVTDPLACMLDHSPGPTRRRHRCRVGAALRRADGLRWARTRHSSPPSESAARAMPGRIVGVSTDTAGRPALRLALQTREQHIRREKATSNICTAQVLLANIAGLYAAWHGPDGLTRIAERVQRLTSIAAAGLRAGGLRWSTTRGSTRSPIEVRRCRCGAQPQRVAAGYNIRRIDATTVSMTFDETSTMETVDQVVSALGGAPVTGARGRPRGRRPRRGAASIGRVPHPVGVRPLPQRARDVALPPSSQRSRPRTRPHDDPPRIVHDETQRHLGDGADHVAGVRRRPSVRSRRPGRGVHVDDQRSGTPSRRDHRLRRGQRPAQRREPGRARRTARDPRLPPVTGRPRPYGLPDPLQRPRDECRQRGDGWNERGGGRMRRPGQRRSGRRPSQGRNGRRLGSRRS